MSLGGSMLVHATRPRSATHLPAPHHGTRGACLEDRVLREKWITLISIWDIEIGHPSI